MKYRYLISCVVLLLAGSLLLSQEPGGDWAERLGRNPNDAAAIESFMVAKLREVQLISQTDPDAALAAVAKMMTILNGLKPDAVAARNELNNARDYLKYVQDQITLAKTPIEELVKRLKQNPADGKVIRQYAGKLLESASELIEDDLAKADKSIKAGKALLATVREKAQDDQEVIAIIDRAQESMEQIGQFIQEEIERQEKLAALVGKDAAPLIADAWVNGVPLTDEDLKGKVVLLDFWAVWCGPCIQLFPRLRAWHETYADQGLVIIGVTDYTRAFAWDSEANRIVQSPSEVLPQDEQAMLSEFAKQYKLKHVFAVQDNETLSEYYAVASIPHLVLVDRQGKIRMVKVGAGPDTAQEIEDMLKRLIDQQGADEKSAATNPPQGLPR